MTNALPTAQAASHSPVTHDLGRMTSAELTRATVACRVLRSELIAPYISDPVLSGGLLDLAVDLEREADERPV